MSGIGKTKMLKIAQINKYNLKLSLLGDLNASKQVIAFICRCCNSPSKCSTMTEARTKLG